MDLIQEVKNRQTQDGLSNRQMAKKLGLPHQTWNSVVIGTRKASYRVWWAIMETYPDLTDDVIAESNAKILRQGVKHENHISAKTNLETPSMP